MKSRLCNLLILCLILAALAVVPGYKDVKDTVGKMSASSVVVIDPGHGGMDGGAESGDGTCEKDINLKISIQLKKQLEKEGIKVIMTRKKDEGLYDESQKAAIRSLKTQDMKERKNIIDKADADLTVSIHLNSFTQDSSVKGAQVFYPAYGDEDTVESSKSAAKTIQENLNEVINIDKDRTELGKSDVFLFRDVKSPIVIVECGFLSNPDDAQNLKKSSYQKKIVKVLKKSVCSHLSDNKS